MGEAKRRAAAKRAAKYGPMVTVNQTALPAKWVSVDYDEAPPPKPVDNRVTCTLASGQKLFIGYRGTGEVKPHHPRCKCVLCKERAERRRGDAPVLTADMVRAVAATMREESIPMLPPRSFGHLSTFAPAGHTTRGIHGRVATLGIVDEMVSSHGPHCTCIQCETLFFGGPRYHERMTITSRDMMTSTLPGPEPSVLTPAQLQEVMAKIDAEMVRSFTRGLSEEPFIMGVLKRDPIG